MVARFRSLRIIVLTILKAFEFLGTILLLLGIVFYIYAVVAVNIFAEYSAGNHTYSDKWENLTSSFVTLFQLLTFDQWYFIHRDTVAYVTPWMTTLYYGSWIFVGGFVFRNVFVGVMVKNFAVIKDELVKKQAEQEKRTNLERMRKRLDKQLNRPAKGEQPANSQMSMIGSVASLQSFTSQSKPKSKSGSTRTATTMKSKRDPVFRSIQKVQTHLNSTQVGPPLVLSRAAVERVETAWPRDTLFRYFQSIEALQENMREYRELQVLAAAALHEFHDT
eukprot:TRINITY_DN21660_c0_g1_i1.p1 TRINITY_DN21660_c0_g1~~TRINITY_DN21660_c0_g1_i1.p1  ORF type:complete len:294 (-),score=29.46 TRINITY_DN21660_c0_g1_i1:178-1008(-)